MSKLGAPTTASNRPSSRAARSTHITLTHIYRLVASLQCSRGTLCSLLEPALTLNCLREPNEQWIATKRRFIPTCSPHEGGPSAAHQHRFFALTQTTISNTSAHCKFVKRLIDQCSIFRPSSSTSRSASSGGKKEQKFAVKVIPGFEPGARENLDLQACDCRRKPSFKIS